MALTDLACRAAKAERLTKLSDGGGLQLWVHPGGGKLWRYAYRFGGKQKLIALGSYPLISLASARAARDAAKRLLIDGIDPAEARREDRAQLPLACGLVRRAGYRLVAGCGAEAGAVGTKTMPAGAEGPGEDLSGRAYRRIDLFAPRRVCHREGCAKLVSAGAGALAARRRAKRAEEDKAGVSIVTAAYELHSDQMLDVEGQLSFIQPTLNSVDATLQLQGFHLPRDKYADGLSIETLQHLLFAG